MRKFFILPLILISFPLFGVELAPEVKKIVDHLDRLYRSETSYSKMNMVIKTPHWERTLTMKAWSRGMNKTFITILAPKKEKGISTLRKETEMWNYFPKINKVMKVPPSMMMGSWMGSDFTNDDLVKESTMLDDYTARLADSKGENWVVELLPKAKTATVWGKIVARVRKSDMIPLTYEYYDEKGRMMRIMRFSEVKEMGGKRIPSVMEIVPQKKKGHSTKIIYLEAEFDKKLPGDTFSLRNLRKRR